MNIKNDIDTIVRYIPIKKLRNSIRNLLVAHFENKFDISILLTENEKLEYLNCIKKSNFYLEFGAGGSTYYALKNTNSIVISVESDLNWINYLRKNDYILSMENFNRLKFFHADIGEILSFGYPINKENNKNKYHNYYDGVFNLFIEHLDKINVVFIDGRFRVACALNTILYCYKNKDIIIMMNDFFNRENYHIVLKFLECIKHIDQLCIFRIKDNINHDEVKRTLEEYKYDLS